MEVLALAMVFLSRVVSGAGSSDQRKQEFGSVLAPEGGFAIDIHSCFLFFPTCQVTVVRFYVS